MTDMKNLLILCLCFFVFSCDKSQPNETKPNGVITACGCEDIQRDLSWLAELIEKSKNDETGNYVGTIWLVNFKGQDIFVTDMMLGSGGILNYFIDCSGNHLTSKSGGESWCPKEFVGDGHFFIEDEDFGDFMRNTELDVVIYSTFPI